MNEKWFSLSVSDIEKKLKTNAASGLSRKAARSRWSALVGVVFSVPSKGAAALLGDIVSDFALIILLIMSILALCFGEDEMGTVLSVLIALNLCVGWIIYYRLDRLSLSIEKFFLPRCRVVREGRLYNVDGLDIVRGDVIMIDEGDILPCDARLVTSDKLRVKMLVEKDKYVLVTKAAEAHVLPNENDIRKHDNIVHAGSVVVGGSARAIVTEIGRYTYIGARIGAIPMRSPYGKRAPRILSAFKKYCSSFSLILLIAVLPFSLICMLFGNATLSLFTVFITAIAIAASTMTQFAVTVCRIFFALPIKKCISMQNSAVIRSCDALDRLASSKFLFVLDGAAVTDGILHFEKLCCAEGEIDLSGRITSSAQKLGELASLYEGAQKTMLSASSQSFGRYDGGIREFLSKIGTDGAALKIRCSVNGFSAANSDDPHDKIFYTDLGDKYILCVSYSDSIISECSNIFVDGRQETLLASSKQSLMNKYREYTKKGRRVLVFSYSSHDGYGSIGERCFVGMLAFSELPDATATAALERIRESGVYPVFFRNIVVDGRPCDVSMIPDEVISGQTVTPADFIRSGKPLMYGFGKISCYSDFSQEQICEMIKAIKAKNEAVTVLGFCEKYDKIYNEADIVVTCSSDEYSLKGHFEEVMESAQGYDDLSKEKVAQTLKQKADIIIPRPAKKKGGGCASLLNALRMAGVAVYSSTSFFRYVVCMQLIRIVLVVLPMLFGSAVLDARHVVFGGMLADLVVMFSYVFEMSGREMPSKYKGLIREISTPIQSNVLMLVCFGGGALLSVILPEMISLIPSAPKYIDKNEYALISFVLFHIAVFVCMKYNGFKRFRKKAFGKITIAYPAFLIVLLLLCFVTEGLASMFGIQGFSSLLYFFITPICPLLATVAYIVFDHFGFDRLIAKKLKR